MLNDANRILHQPTFYKVLVLDPSLFYGLNEKMAWLVTKI